MLKILFRYYEYLLTVWSKNFKTEKITLKEQYNDIENTERNVVVI